MSPDASFQGSLVNWTFTSHETKHKGFLNLGQLNWTTDHVVCICDKFGQFFLLCYWGPLQVNSLVLGWCGGILHNLPCGGHFVGQE